jgi:UDP-GlcNAc:undecaprenyl-phosphate/decaprenyl-phosphate GlcNAc-1-phosphate transferase
MILKMALTGMAILGIAIVAAQASPADEQPLKTEKDMLSYALGVDLARNSTRNGIQIDPDIVLKGIKDALSGEKLLLSEEGLRQRLIEAQTEVRQRQARLRTAPEINRQRGEAFLAANKKKEGVVALPSGLQYQVIKAGEGKKPTESDTVEINYRGTLLDGIEFIRSKPDVPGTFKVGEAFLPALKEALPLMTVGSKWRLWVPPQLAYGDRGVGRQIGPKETIIFEVELLSIK